MCFSPLLTYFLRKSPTTRPTGKTEAPLFTQSLPRPGVRRVHPTSLALAAPCRHGPRRPSPHGGEGAPFWARTFPASPSSGAAPPVLPLLRCTRSRPALSAAAALSGGGPAQPPARPEPAMRAAAERGLQPGAGGRRAGRGAPAAAAAPRRRRGWD